MSTIDTILDKWTETRGKSIRIPCGMMHPQLQLAVKTALEAKKASISIEEYVMAVASETSKVLLKNDDNDYALGGHHLAVSLIVFLGLEDAEEIIEQYEKNKLI